MAEHERATKLAEAVLAELGLKANQVDILQALHFDQRQHHRLNPVLFSQHPRLQLFVMGLDNRIAFRYGGGA